MRLWVSASAFVLTGLLPCFAQEPTAPATLEGSLQSNSAINPAFVNGDGGSKTPEGTLTRPTDGVQHPALDEAWANYTAACGEVAEEVRALITRQFDVATTKGDLEAAEKWHAALEQFEKQGVLPTTRETKAGVSAALADYKKARAEVAQAYEAVVRTLTTEKNIALAKEVRNEWVGITTKSDHQGRGTEEPHLPSPSLPREAVRFKGHAYYYFDSQRMTQEDAAAKCRELGGYLVRIENAAEWKFVASYLMRRVDKRTNQELEVWIDGTDSRSEGRWLFFDGTPMTYFAFAAPEPRGGTRENGVAVKAVKDAAVWNDYPQNAAFGFICEWENR